MDNACWYDPARGRFAQADTIVPVDEQGTQAWDRYAYVSNNPLRYLDPSGDGAYCGDDYDPGCLNPQEEGAFNLMSGKWETQPPYAPTSDNQPEIPGTDLATIAKADLSEPITPESPSVESFEPIAFFMEEIALPFFSFIGTYEDAIDFGKPIYKQARFLLPFGLIEASGNAILQGYHDRWEQSLNPAQRTGRMVIVGVETLYYG